MGEIKGDSMWVRSKERVGVWVGTRRKEHHPRRKEKRVKTVKHKLKWEQIVAG